MKLPWVDPDTPLPPVEYALSDPDGLLAAGGDLSVERLTEAYSRGIFPWYSEGEPVLWWSPNPRMVLACDDFAVSHSMAKLLRRLGREEQQPDARTQVRVDTAFEQVLQACAAPRDRAGTWITATMREAYTAWHHAGTAHSVEVWVDGRLCAGLYGISLGAMFYGESMFTHITDGSKIALAHLVRFLASHGVPWIDCQQQTRHLASLGARPLPRAQFVARVSELVTRPAPPWQRGRLDTQGRLLPLPEATP
ncbi:MAG TPA: leucyl/phenylalanyl-tRNA--protein transferase [Bordetella sp.]|nr:leucyl/phenylalanyl-tRNA--protein transferase [Bordetella sp.]